MRLQELGFVLAGPRALASGLKAHSLGFSVVSVMFQVGTLQTADVCFWGLQQGKEHFEGSR